MIFIALVLHYHCFALPHLLCNITLACIIIAYDFAQWLGQLHFRWTMIRAAGLSYWHSNRTFNECYNSIMLGWSKTVTMGLRLFIRPSNVMRFSQNNWRDRDEAAEKVYISQQEGTNLST